MSSDFMPMALDSLSSQASAYASSKTGSTYTEEELRRMGINLVDPEDSGLQFEDFLQLMVSQLQNQTIDNTADTSDMLNQLVQMSTVEMLVSVQESLEALVSANTLNYAASLVGKTVTVGQYDENGNIQEIVGTVTGTGTYQGTSVIFVDGEMYALNDIMAVGTLPSLPEQPSEGGESGEGGNEAAGETTQSVG
ncbi:flagellar hook assembly protein FlgD [Intestinimonas butyriciproducens]|uniref:flagellar hook assembly protein FlgD n=1 Tax=Intestinimonas butyriciproducens TaxID=1297617 RepID=UPI00195A2FE5|nr:flagellar hook capping FlgD N-terminal domain-containing protein [Intestinimonas butyriciproducens]MBM6976172.1 flagellar hook capping protein [Intestinimonas butyriciproducens]